MGLLTGDDSTIFRQFFKEMTKLRGISIEYIYPIEDEVSIHGEIDSKFSSIYPIDIIFETNPKIKTLKNYGWVSESPNDKPYIAYLPFDTPHIQTKARLKLPSIGGNKSGRWFEITDVTESIEFPDAYICKLVPVFNSDEPMLDYSETNHNYIEGDNQPNESTEHNHGINESLIRHIHDNAEKSIDDSKNFSFLKI